MALGVRDEQWLEVTVWRCCGDDEGEKGMSC